MTDDEIIALGDRNYYEAWTLLARTADGGDVREIDGVLIASPASEVLWLNIAFVTRPLAGPDAQLAATKAYFAEHGLGFLVRIREGLDEAAERACERLGMQYTDTIPGMALAPIPPAPEGAPPVEVREVDASTFDAFVELNAASFDIPLDACRRTITPRLLESPDARWYLGLAGGTPVATSVLFVTDRIAGVHFVSTDAAYRGRGIGEAMTRHAVLEGAKLGLTAGYLEASEMGYPIYQRMGFRHVTGYKTYVPKEFL